METEAWFIGDFSHFEKIDGNLTPEFILDQTGIDVKSINVESEIDAPASQLNAFYELVGKNYEKNLTSLSRTVKSLDYPYMFFELPSRVSKLKELIDLVEKFIVY